MERLTFEGNFCDIAQCADVRYGSFCEDGACSQRKVWERLKMYEDTGLEPDRICEFMEKWVKVVELAGLMKQEGIEHLRELVRAEKDSRLVVLPCGVNDTAWYVDKDTNRVLMGYISSYQFLSDGAVYFEFTNIESDIEWVSVELPVDDFGKTVFLTREEAEKALEGGRSDGEA